jgi:hypothetical protein
MSTEHQQYSPENQLDIIRQYAADHNMEIIHVYSDHGRSGLNIAGRDGLNQLMADVENMREKKPRLELRKTALQRWPALATWNPFHRASPHGPYRIWK